MEESDLYMLGKTIVLLAIMGALLLSSGCSDILGPSGFGLGSSPDITITPTPVPTPLYGIGDIAIKNPNDQIGEVVQNYDPISRKYSTRTIVLGGFGDVSFYEGGRTNSFNLQDFEAQYPYKWGNVDNPFNLPSPTREYKPKYSVNQVVTKENIQLEGIKILSYDYPRDAYTYIYVYKRGSAWVSLDNITYTGARTDVEERYAEKDV